MIFSGVTISDGGFQVSPPPAPPILLMHFDGTNGSNVFIDSSCANTSFTGSALLSTANFKFGNASLGADNTYINTGNIVNGGGTWDLRFSDWTIEGWCYRIGELAQNDSRPLFSIGVEFSNLAQLSVEASSTQVTASVLVTDDPSYQSATVTNPGGNFNDSWVSWAATKSDNQLRVFINGISSSVTTLNVNTSSAPTGNVWIGARTFTNQVKWRGYIDELRVTKGLARYTSNYTPASAPFPDPEC